jgi:hypothetical protein
MRRFPPPWTVEKIPGGLKVLNANGQSLAYVYSRETKDAAQIAKVLIEDEARRIVSEIPKRAYRSCGVGLGFVPFFAAWTHTAPQS